MEVHTYRYTSQCLRALRKACSAQGQGYHLHFRDQHKHMQATRFQGSISMCHEHRASVWKGGMFDAADSRWEYYIQLTPTMNGRDGFSL